MLSPQKLLTVPALQEFLSISKAQVFYLIAEGLPSVPIGAKKSAKKVCRRFEPDEVLKWLKERNTPKTETRRELLKARGRASRGGAK